MQPDDTPDWCSLIEKWPKQDACLKIPKDVWRLIAAECIKQPNWIGLNTDYVIALRSVCKYFAELITPHFCLRVIFMNPDANNFAFGCGVCTFNSRLIRTGGTYVCKKHWREQNEYCGYEDVYKYIKYKWIHNPKKFRFEPPLQRANIIRRPIFRKTIPQTKQPPPLRYCTESYLTKRGTNNPQKIDADTYYSKSRKARNRHPHRSNCNVSRSVCNKKKDKFWKKKEFDDNYDRYDF